jgi:hypothetical protein
VPRSTRDLLPSSTERLMAVWWQAKMIASARLHQTAADDAYSRARLRAMRQCLGRRVTCCRRSSGAVRLIRVLKMLRTATRAKAHTMNCSSRRLLPFLFRTSPGSLAMLAAMRRASSRVRNFVAPASRVYGNALRSSLSPWPATRPARQLARPGREFCKV